MILDCNSTTLNNVFYITKNILNLIMIIAPILAIISFTFLLIRLIMNPEEKKIPKQFKNSIMALVIIFFIPLLVNIVMSLLGESTDISSCYNNATKQESSTYKSITDENSNTWKIGSDANEYEGGDPKHLNFFCKSTVIKAQFSCDTLHIVAKHTDDFNYYNFNSVINSYGGFENYAKSLGGVFSDYYGKKLEVTTVYEFQRVAEYVFGFMYMYGFDYFNGLGDREKGDSSKHYCKWGGSCVNIDDHYDKGALPSPATSDGFYPGQMMYINNGLSNRKDVDRLISGADGLNMTTNCNWTVDMVYYKAGIFGTGRVSTGGSASIQSLAAEGEIISDVKDLKVGDILGFYSNKIDNTNPSTWSGWRHTAFVGEVDEKTGIVTIYDGGSYYPTNRNYKWTIDTNKEVTSLMGYPGWSAVRVVDLH